MKVKFLPYQPHCFAFGGFEIQTLSTLMAIQEAGVDASPLNVWEKDNDFDILHCWGLEVGNYANLFWAKKSGKKVVVTALFPYYESFKEKFKFALSAVFYKAKLMREMAAMADHVIVVNDIQASICHRYFGVSKEKITVIPNVVKKAFYDIEDKDESFSRKYGITDFILSTGNICRRKNQLNLAKACINSKIKLVLIGKVLDGEADYGHQLESIVRAHDGIMWLPGLEPGSEDLVGAYSACTAFALPSYEEQQPISLLEAAAQRKPLLIADKAYAFQKYYKNAVIVKPGSISSIERGIKEINTHPELYIPPATIVRECTGEQVGKAYANLYHSLLA